MLTILRFFPVGLAAGICSGIFGIGGGVIIIPFLIFAFGFNQQTANGVSLVALLLPVGLLGVIAYYRAGVITTEHVKMGLSIATGMFFGAYFGARFALALPEVILRRSFAIFLCALAVRLWMKN